jgi:hypothetical protein
MVFWDDLGLATNYTVDAEVEYPGDGVWGIEQVRIAGMSGALAAGPQALIRPALREPWLLVAGFPELGSLYASADPGALCMVSRFDRAVLINTEEPSVQTLIHDNPVSVASSLDHGLLLIADFWTISAFDSTGLRWQSKQLVEDDLHIRRTDGDWIVCRGAGVDPAHPVEVTVDARTGDVIQAVR